MSCTGYVIQINAERLEKPTALLACFSKKTFVYFTGQKIPAGLPYLSLVA